MRKIFLVAGPSGSGKSRLAAETGCPHLGLDDFYRDGDAPGLPRTLGIVDWDDVATWDLDAAAAVLRDAATAEVVEVPTYAIAQNARIGGRPLALAGAKAVVAEGVFAVDALVALRASDLDIVPIWLDRPRTLVALLRLARDVRERRKPLGVLLRRGFALWRAEPALRRRAVDAGFVPLTMRGSLARVRGAA